MIKINGLIKVYRTDTVETRVLNSVDLEIKEGDFVAVIGPSGAGKSTLLNVIGLLENFDAGSLSIAGQQIIDLKDNALSKLRSEQLGFIFQSFNLLPELSIEQNIQLPLEIRGFKRKAIKQKTDEVLESVGLLKRADHKPPQLSGGQQQRAAIARALAGQPNILLADEPTGNLNSEMAREIMQMLLDINAKGTTIVMVTHDLDLASKASRIVEIIDGQVADKPNDFNSQRKFSCV